MFHSKTVQLNVGGIDWSIELDSAGRILLVNRRADGEESWELINENRIPDNVLIQLGKVLYRAKKLSGK